MLSLLDGGAAGTGRNGSGVDGGRVWSTAPDPDCLRGDGAHQVPSTFRWSRVVSTGACTGCGMAWTLGGDQEAQLPSGTAGEGSPSPPEDPGIMPAEGPALILDVHLGYAKEEVARGNILNTCPDHLKSTLSESDLSLDQLKAAVRLLNDYQDVFVGPDGEGGSTHLVKYRIATGGVKSFKLLVRRLDPAQCEIHHH